MAVGEAPEANDVALTLRVPDVAPLARQYGRLGLRVVEQTATHAVVQLPCGILLVLKAQPRVQGKPLGDGETFSRPFARP